LIFVVTGTQKSFDRLHTLIVEWLKQNPTQEIIFQGKVATPFENIKYVNNVDIEEFEGLIKTADLIITHAGIGTILNCLEFNKPMIIFPRFADYDEHRNNHQIDTCDFLKESGNYSIAYGKIDLFDLLRGKITETNPQVNLGERERLVGFVANWMN